MGRIQWLEVMNCSFTWVPVHGSGWLLVVSLARLLRNCDVGPANLFRIGQAWGNRWCRRWEFAIVEIKFFDPIPESEELGCFDELDDNRKHQQFSESEFNGNAPLALNPLP
jgi:hypothetical protein